MAIPDYQTIMLPLLKLVRDKQVYKMSSVTESLAVQYNLTDEERAVTIRSGTQSLFYNRVAWARTVIPESKKDYRQNVKTTF